MSTITRKGRLLNMEAGSIIIPQHLKQAGLKDISELSDNQKSRIYENFKNRLRVASISDSIIQVTLTKVLFSDTEVVIYGIDHHYVIPGSLSEVGATFTYSHYSGDTQKKNVIVLPECLFIQSTEKVI